VENLLSPQFILNLVSIIVPTHDRASLLGKAIASVAAQTYRPIECIVVDDGSTDNIQGLVEDIRPSIDSALELRYVRQKQSGGCAARNRGLRESHGEFIAFLDSDDELLPEAIQRKVERLRASSAAYCYDRGQRVDESGAELGFFGQEWPSEGPVIWRYLFDTNAPLIRRSLCVQLGPWNESLQGNQEVEYFARLIILAGRGEYIPEVGHRILEHGGPRIVSLSAHARARLQSWEMILSHLSQDGVNYAADRAVYAKFLRETFAVAAGKSYAERDYRAAFDNLGKACQYGYRRWHVKLYLRLFPLWPRVVSHGYFWPRRFWARMEVRRRRGDRPA
jgi:glycosyltransferase involved in cell wall biosynthesis